MTTEEIEKRLKDIEETQGDDEIAHQMEDRLYKDFIAYVASLDNHTLSAKARLVLTAQGIKFARWYA